MNLIKKLIITSLVIFSCDNIIASENLKNSNISDNQQMQNTLPINNNTVNNTDNKEWVNFIKEPKIKELMNDWLNNYENYKQKLIELQNTDKQKLQTALFNLPNNKQLFDTLEKDCNINTEDFITFLLGTLFENISSYTNITSYIESKINNTDLLQVLNNRKNTNIKKWEKSGFVIEDTNNAMDMITIIHDLWTKQFRDAIANKDRVAAYKFFSEFLVITISDLIRSNEILVKNDSILEKCTYKNEIKDYLLNNNELLIKNIPDITKNIPIFITELLGYNDPAMSTAQGKAVKRGKTNVVNLFIYLQTYLSQLQLFLYNLDINPNTLANDPAQNSTTNNSDQK